MKINTFIFKQNKRYLICKGFVREMCSVKNCINGIGCSEHFGIKIIKQITPNIKFKYQEVYEYFKEKGCKLLSEKYINNKEKLNYICICGKESTTRFCDFKNGSILCIECGKKK